MTSYAKAPDAPAVVLLYDESEGATSAEVTVHVRVKVLKESGLSAGTVDLPFLSTDPFDQEVYARTIHPDGAIIPYSGKPLDQMDSIGQKTKVLALPDVTVGSILEYGYHFRGLTSFYTYLEHNFAPHWVVQEKYFVCTAHFHLDTSDIDPASVLWVGKLPEGAEVKRIKNGAELNLTDVPALPGEDYMPPPAVRNYHVRFFYWSGTRNSYWGTTANDVDDHWMNFYKPSKSLTADVNQIIAPGDNDEQKLRKLYDAVMTLENTDLTRERSKREDKTAGLKEAHNSEDVWLRKRGTSNKLALLYVALARAAGYPAYPMAVTSRNWGAFNQDVLSWSQLDDMIAIVSLNGHEFFFDPGTRDCPFGHLAWWHSNVGGISFEGKQLKFRLTPAESVGAQTQRLAELKLNPDGDVEGTLTITWNYIAALSNRRQFLREDQQAVENTIANNLQARIPVGVQLKLISLKGLDTYNGPLVATFSVSGKLATVTGKRLIVPAEFFASREKPIFSSQTRTQDIAFPEIFALQDTVRLTLPPSIAVEALPETKTLLIDKDVGYQVRASASGNQILIQRGYS